MKKINKICKLIKALTPEDFQEVQEMYKSQQAYISPLKPVKQCKINDIGWFNELICEDIQQAREHILDLGKIINKK